ncbi:MAG TPA: 4-hydroxy-tetrahydrodipicolinate synthase [Methylomirabilota bacterium]|jgi:4-hydroxy-tetrahydrodipicolinate synthase
MRLSGVWLPVITPFKDDAIDHASYARLVDHYVRAGVTGIIPLGTTGESPTLDEAESDALIERTVAAVAGRVPILVGVGGNDTRKVVKAVKRLEKHPVQGILSVCPYYNRPSQDGMREHFTLVAGATDRPILIYNVPYRTGVNLANETLLALAEVPNIAGVKDSTGNLAQSLDLLRQRPAGFTVLTGEDAFFYTMLAHGGDGGILASAHVETAAFLAVYERMAANDHQGALKAWARLEAIVPLLFREANPMPIKHCLWRQGLIDSAECRLPLTRVSDALARDLDRLVPAGIAG